MTHRHHHDGVLIVGAGLAGLSAALAAAPRKALVLSPTPLNQGCSSAWAQGGMAAALGEDDTPALHAADTIAAGAGLCDAEMVEVLTREGPDAVRKLAAMGAPFDRAEDGSFAQSLEAAHGRARVARVKGDQAGREIMRAVVATAFASPLVESRAGVRVRNLLRDGEGRVRGVVTEYRGAFWQVTADAVILAGGGLGGLYAVTTTPPEVRGEALGLAALHGALIADPEFVQFHPTAIDIGRDPAPLATEALRGEGAILVNALGEPFMAAYHPAAELAPRDVVARAIHAEIEAGRGAFLDARRAVGDHFPTAFPAVYAACLSAGIDPRMQRIPVAPACHYHMGGVATDATGATTLEGLWAAGECASTGVHGANRLASNSLLEAAVFGARAGEASRENIQGKGRVELAAPLPDLKGAALMTLRRAMTRHAGVVRDAGGLGKLVDTVEGLKAAHGEGPVLATAGLVARCALARKESRGAHFRADFPQAVEPAERTFVTLPAPQALKVAAE